MTLRNLMSRLRSIVKRRKMESEMAAEFEDHVSRHTEELIRRGVSPADAARRARLDFGGVEAIKEECREARGVRLIDELRGDLRFAFRSLRSNPTFTVVAVLTLALGIGANSAMFSVVNAVLIEPLPYAAPESLVALWESSPAAGKQRDDVAYMNMEDWRTRSNSFSNMALFRDSGFSWSGGEYAEQIPALEASFELFKVLGVEALHGRVYTPEEEKRNERVVVLSHSFWSGRLQADPTWIGRSLDLNGAAYTVLGVMPPEFRFPVSNPDVALWHPLALSRGDTQSRVAHSFQSVARLRPGVSVEAAHSELNGIARQIASQAAESNPAAVVASLREESVGGFRDALIVLWCTVGFVLLIASVNVANLLLARTTARRKEMALRTTLGAGRSRLIRQLLTESIVLSLLGGILGLVLAVGFRTWRDRLIPADLLSINPVELDLTVLGFTALTTLATGVLFGLVPALQLSRTAVVAPMSDDGRTTAAGATRRVRSLLVIGEVSLSLILLVAAGLMLRSLSELRRTDPGFLAAGVLTGQIWLPQSRYPLDRTQFRPVQNPSPVLQPQSRFFEDLIQRLQNTPGVQSAGAVTSLPMNPEGIDFDMPIVVVGQPPVRGGEAPQADFRIATPGYFPAMRIPVVEGRLFDASDQPHTAPVILVNEELARRFLPGGSPVGQRLMLYGRPREVIGVVGSVRHRGLDTDPRPEMILPHTQFALGGMTVVVRSTLEVETAARAIRNAAREVDPEQPVFNLRRMDEFVEGSQAQRRFQTTVIGLFAAIALLLSMIGIYGVISYSVNLRTGELGIRMALGASRAQLMGMVLNQAMKLTAAGIGIGLIGAWLLARWLESLLFQVTTADPQVYLLVPVVLALAALGAGLIPARRATRLDPNLALKR